MIDPALIPKLRALWAEADAAFRIDDAYVVEMAEESAKVYARRMAARARREAAAQAAVEIAETVPEVVSTPGPKRPPLTEAQRAAKAAYMRDWYRRNRRPQTDEERAARQEYRHTEDYRALARQAYAEKMAAMTEEERKAWHRAKNERTRAKRRGDVGGSP